MKLIEMDGDKIIIAPEAIVIQEFRTLWDNDDSKTKELAKQQLCYVYYFCEWESPYAKYIDSERAERIIEDLELPRHLTTSSEVQMAIDKYYELNTTTSMLLLAAARTGIDKLKKYFETVDLTDLDKNGKPIYKATDLTSNLKSVGTVVTQLKKLEDEVKKEQVDSSTIKGGGQAGFFEDVDQ